MTTSFQSDLSISGRIWSGCGHWTALESGVQLHRDGSFYCPECDMLTGSCVVYCILLKPSILLLFIIQAYYGHIMHMDDNADAKRILLASPRQTGADNQVVPASMAQHRPTGSEITPPYAPQSSRFGSEPPSVEDDVDVWRYAIVSCMSETTTTTTIQYVHIQQQYWIRSADWESYKLEWQGFVGP